jgi:hypothetical protein
LAGHYAGDEYWEVNLPKALLAALEAWDRAKVFTSTGLKT